MRFLAKDSMEKPQEAQYIFLIDQIVCYIQLYIAQWGSLTVTLQLNPFLMLARIII